MLTPHHVPAFVFQVTEQLDLSAAMNSATSQLDLSSLIK